MNKLLFVVVVALSLSVIGLSFQGLRQASLIDRQQTALDKSTAALATLSEASGREGKACENLRAACHELRVSVLPDVPDQQARDVGGKGQ